MPHRPPVGGPLARLVKSAEFQRVLRSRSRAATPHFAVHHAAAAAATSAEVRRSELSTTRSATSERPVDDLSPASLDAPARWLGAVVPKRHARRAVTRSLLKRQIYAAAERHRACLGHGVWIVRLRAPFDRTQFASAASAALKLSARGELESLFAIVARAADGAAR